MISEAGELRPAGRPRSSDADEAILRATLELCVEEGFEGTSVEAVAARARVGKATVYRRYPNRIGLLVAAANHVCGGMVDDIDTGTVAGDLRLIAHGVVRTLNSSYTRGLLAEVTSAASRNPELRAEQRQFVTRRRAVTIGAIQRGIDRGELGRDTDPELAADLLGAPLFHHAISLGEPVDEPYADALVDAVLRAFAAD